MLKKILILFAMWVALYTTTMTVVALWPFLREIEIVWKQTALLFVGMVALWGFNKSAWPLLIKKFYEIFDD